MDRNDLIHSENHVMVHNGHWPWSWLCIVFPVSLQLCSVHSFCSVIVLVDSVSRGVPLVPETSLLNIVHKEIILAKLFLME